jgi:hypothetical protein
MLDRDNLLTDEVYRRLPQQLHPLIKYKQMIFCRYL